MMVENIVWQSRMRHFGLGKDIAAPIYIAHGNSDSKKNAKVASFVMSLQS